MEPSKLDIIENYPSNFANVSINLESFSSRDGRAFSAGGFARKSLHKLQNRRKEKKRKGHILVTQSQLQQEILKM